MERSQPVGAGSIPTTNTVVIVVKVDGPPSSLAALDGTITEAVAWPRRDSPPRGFAPRHTTASLAVSACANVEEVQRMLAHASAAMALDLYADLFDVDLENVADALKSARLASSVGNLSSRCVLIARNPRNHWDVRGIRLAEPVGFEPKLKPLDLSRLSQVPWKFSLFG